VVKYQYVIPGKQLQPEPWKSGWWQYRMPRLGEIDWKEFISTLQKHGYDYILSIEHEDPIWEGSEEKIKTGLKMGTEHLKQSIP
jgi:sugar phosphate isomerase/epimerase